MIQLPSFSPLDSVPGEPGARTRYDVVAAARTLIGTPYLHQHRMRGHGIDCVGVPIWVSRELGLVAPEFDVNAYARKPNGTTLHSRCCEYMDPVAPEDAKPGHVLLLAYRKDPQHMGILADYHYGGLSLIHAYGSTDGKGQVEEWHLQVQRRAFQPLAVFSLRGVV